MNDVEQVFPGPGLRERLEQVMLAEIEMGIGQEQTGANVDSVQPKLFLGAVAGQVEEPGT